MAIIQLKGGAVSNEFLNDLAGLLSKYVGPVGGAPAGKDAVLDVATGKLTLEQINLLFRHFTGRFILCR